MSTCRGCLIGAPTPANALSLSCCKRCCAVQDLVVLLLQNSWNVCVNGYVQILQHSHSLDHHPTPLSVFPVLHSVVHHQAVFLIDLTVGDAGIFSNVYWRPNVCNDIVMTPNKPQTATQHIWSHYNKKKITTSHEVEPHVYAGWQVIVAVSLNVTYKPSLLTLSLLNTLSQHYCYVHSTWRQFSWTKRTYISYIMMTSSNGNIFRVTGHLCGEFTGPRWIPHTGASDAELWYLLWSAPE